MKRSNKRDLFGLAPDGVYLAFDITAETVSSYLTISPLPVPRTIGAIGRFFSVALSVGFPLLRVTERPVLWSSDFPHPNVRDAIAWTTLDCFVIKKVTLNPPGF